MSYWERLFTADDTNLTEVKNLKERGPFDFVCRNSETLFVTIGDSWTYGARLDEEDLSDSGFRIKNTYGYTISKHLNTDFLNISVPGINNLWMIEKLELLIKNVSDYKNVRVILMMTEYGREFNTNFDMDPKLNQIYKNCNSAYEVIKSTTAHYSNRIEKCSSNKVKIDIFTNYVSNIYKNGKQTNWLEILCNKKLSDCYTIGSWVIPKFEHLVDHNQDVKKTDLKKELLNMMELAEKRFDIIYNTGYNHKSGYGHPNSKGHLKFAEYYLEKHI